MGKKLFIAVGVIFFFALELGTGVRAWPQAEKVPSIRVTGEAEVTASPDQAEIDVGVVSQAEKAEAAARENADRLDRVLRALRALLGSGAEIKTAGYSLSPNYRYPKEGGGPVVTGYTATNTVRVKTGEMAMIGKIIDVAAQAGANRIQRLQFGLKDEKAAVAEALGRAAAQARAKAEAIASALGLKIVQVLQVEEAGPVRLPRPMLETSQLRAAAAPTPIEPGEITIQATVTLTVGVGQ